MPCYLKVSRKSKQ